MYLIINQNKKFFATPPSSLAALMLCEYPNVKGIAVAINNKVVPQSQWASTKLYDEDSILIITATQGG